MMGFCWMLCIWLFGRISRDDESSSEELKEDAAVGCCAFGLFGGSDRDDDDLASSEKEEDVATIVLPSLWNETLPPYLGPMPTNMAIKEAIAWAAPWLDVELIQDESKRNDITVEELASGGVVAIYNRRSELGPRALGHRSILADPRKKGLVRFINEFAKKRESFRPFAPSCLAEEAGNWFDLGEHAAANNNNVSPYMGITAQVKGEPITETPRNAVRSFLSSMGTM